MTAFQSAGRAAHAPNLQEDKQCIFLPRNKWLFFCKFLLHQQETDDRYRDRLCYRKETF